MEASASALRLSELDVLVVDCQATAVASRGHLLEIGWARAGAALTPPTAYLIAMPDGARIPPAVARITGITDRMMRAGLEPGAAWRALAATASTITSQPAPTIIHFARFEGPFLRRLAGGAPPLDVVCTHAIAQRLLPDLPRRSLRALAGYFGRAVGALRRSADHVDATSFVWRQLVPLLEAEGVSTWNELKTWLLTTAPTRSRRRVWPMPPEIRLNLPDAPGIYRMLRTGGEVLYVGKAASLYHRVNSYFRHQHGFPERMLEMLSQARAISFDMTPSALEAALLEADEIKRLQPPYNTALTDGDRHLWFAARNLCHHSPQPSARCPVGPFPSAETLEQFAALTEGSRTAVGRGRWAPEVAVFDEGYARFREAHMELSLVELPMAARLLRIGRRLWREGRRDRDADADEGTGSERRMKTWTPVYVQLSLEWLVTRAALARRRATWFTRLADATVAWQEPEASRPRRIVVENGEMRTVDDADGEPAVPPGYRRSAMARREAFTLARFDRLRVLTTELKRLSAAGAPVGVRFGTSPPIAGARLASLLAWL